LFLCLNGYLLVRNRVNRSVREQSVDQSAVSQPGGKPASKCPGVKCFEARVGYLDIQLRIVTHKVALGTFFLEVFSHRACSAITTMLHTHIHSFIFDAIYSLDIDSVAQ